MDNRYMIERLKKAGISFAPGMSAEALDRAEAVFQFRFPGEIREFLSCGVLVGDGFFDYRDVSAQNREIFQRFQDSIEDCFRFELENNREEMLEMLGQRPGLIRDAEGFDEAVMKYLHQSVRLIPFYAHRCFFDGLDGMPIVSFWQPTDTILYGGTLENYLEVEFLKKKEILEDVSRRMKKTGIWADLIE